MTRQVKVRSVFIGGGAPVAIPDFTNGKWISRKFEHKNKWSI